jgi:ABC-type sugar transport system ATPase subunit
VGEGVRIPLPVELRAGAAQAVTIGMRPEHLVEGGTGTAFRLKVDTVEALGADSLLHCAFGANALVVRVDGHRTPEPGAALNVSAMPGKTYFFDTATGQRLRP